MGAIKVWNASTSSWEIMGAAGPAGSNGTNGADGVSGALSVYEPQNHVSTWQAWTIDPRLVQPNSNLSNQSLYFYRVRKPVTGPITNMITYISTAGSSLTSAYLGVYSQAGVLLGQTANSTTTFQSTGLKSVPLTAPTSSIAAGTMIYLSMLFASGTTVPAMYYFSGSGILANIGLSAADGYAQGQLAGQTTMPSTLSFASATTRNEIFFVACN